jgi:oligopeptide transport system ATP-binding protein
MYLGRIVETGPVDKVYRAPSHPYTAALLSAVPVLSTERRRERIVLKGDPPSPGNIPPGCPFQNRCWLREKLGNPEICTTTRPDLTPAIDDMARSSACHFSGDVTASLPPESVPTADSSGATS